MTMIVKILNSMATNESLNESINEESNPKLDLVSHGLTGVLKWATGWMLSKWEIAGRWKVVWAKKEIEGERGSLPTTEVSSFQCSMCYNTFWYFIILNVLKSTWQWKESLEIDLTKKGKSAEYHFQPSNFTYWTNAVIWSGWSVTCKNLAATT